MSGSGDVARECSEEQLDNWSVIMTKWKDVKSRPKQVKSLIRKRVTYLPRSFVKTVVVLSVFPVLMKFRLTIL